MTTRRRNALVERVSRYYLTSHDFNGVPGRDLLSGRSTAALVKKVSRLVEKGLLTIEFGDRHPNPHIKCFEEETAEVAVEKLGRLGLRDACLYPSRTVLAEAVDPNDYAGRPYDLALALGEGQLALRFFDLVVLESYRSDPRFHYDCDDVGGRFSAKWEATESGALPPKDQTFIQEFGFAYNKSLDRCDDGALPGSCSAVRSVHRGVARRKRDVPRDRLATSVPRRLHETAEACRVRVPAETHSGSLQSIRASPRQVDCR